MYNAKAEAETLSPASEMALAGWAAQTGAQGGASRFVSLLLVLFRGWLRLTRGLLQSGEGAHLSC